MLLRGYQITKADQIGGGVVRHAFRMGSHYLLAGTRLTAEAVMSIGRPNRAALIDKGMLAVWPKGDDVPFKGQRFVAHRGAGLYDVYEGRKLNAEPLTSREEAEELAGSKPPH